MHVRDDRILETSTTTGTGALTLAGAVSGYRPFSSSLRDDGTAIQVGDTVWYYAENVDANGNVVADSNGNTYEGGKGTYSAASQLTRTEVLRSSNANAACNWAAGSTRRVYLTLIGIRTAMFDADLAMALPAVTAEPVAPPTGWVKVYAREIVPGHVVLKTVRPSGVDSPLQDDIAFNNITKMQGGGTVMVAVGCAVLTASAAGTAVTPTSGTAKSVISRTQYATSATAGALHTLVGTAAGNHSMLRGNVNGQGGFRKVFRFGMNALVAGNRVHMGIAGSTTAPTNIDPLAAATPARIGIGFNANTGNLFICGSDGTTAWSTDLGANFPLNNTDLWELVLFCRPHNGTAAGDISYRVRRYTTNFNVAANEVTGTRSANLPAATTLLYPWIFLTNNATAAACSWQLGHIARQSDS